MIVTDQMKRDAVLARQSEHQKLSIDERIKKAQSRKGSSAKELARLYKLKAEGNK